jgi:hypothetical protein
MTDVKRSPSPFDVLLGSTGSFVSQADSVAKRASGRSRSVTTPSSVKVDEKGHVKFQDIRQRDAMASAMAQLPAGMPALILTGRAPGDYKAVQVPLAKVWKIEAGMKVPEERIALDKIGDRIGFMTTSNSAVAKQPRLLVSFSQGKPTSKAFQLDAKNLSVKDPLGSKDSLKEKLVQPIGILAPLDWEPQ